MPTDMKYWRDYVQALVERYDGDGVNDVMGLQTPIKYWQLENEFLAQWKGTDDQFVGLVRATREAIKNADPDAKLISPGFTGLKFFALKDGINKRGWTYHGNTDRARKQVKAAMIRNRKPLIQQHTRAQKLVREFEPLVDVFDVHLYSFDHLDMSYQLAWMQQQLRELGSEKPIWSLEFAAPFFDFSKQRFHRLVVTSQIVGFHQGLDRIFWSSLAPTTGWSTNYLRLSLATQTGRPKPAFEAYALAARHLEGFQSIEKDDKYPGVEMFRFQFPPPRNGVVVAWATDLETEVELTFETPMTMLELAPSGKSHDLSRGKTDVKITEQPVLFIDQSWSRQ